MISSIVPIASIILPVRNGQDCICNAIKSLQKQTIREIEIIVVDDCSTDSTRTIIAGVQADDPRIIAKFLPQQMGVHEARKHGIDIASAPWIGFLDADDYISDRFLEIMVGKAIQNKSDIVICGSERVDINGKSLGYKVNFKLEKSYSSKIFKNFCSLQFGSAALWNKIYSASLIKKWGTMPQRWPQNGTEDTIVNIGCFLDAASIVTIPNVLHKYVFNPSSLTSSIQSEKGFEKIVRAFATAVDLYSYQGSEALAGIADLYRAQLNYPSYAVDLQDSLPEWADSLAEPLCFLAQDHPKALAMLIARLPGIEKPRLLAKVWRTLKRLTEASYE